MATQVVIQGSAATLLQAAKTFGKRVVKPGIRAFAIPQDNEQYAEAIDNGAIRALHKAGFTICAPGTPEPALAEGDTEVAYPDGVLEDLLIEATR